MSARSSSVAALATAEYAAFRDFWHIRPTMEAALDALAQKRAADGP